MFMDSSIRFLKNSVDLRVLRALAPRTGVRRWNRTVAEEQARNKIPILRAIPMGGRGKAGLQSGVPRECRGIPRSGPSRGTLRSAPLCPGHPEIEVRTLFPACS